MTMPTVSSSRVRLADVARGVGGSPATVDRALHGRPGVRPRTLEQVNRVGRRLGYRPDPAAMRLGRARGYSRCFLLPKGSNSFVGMLAEQVRSLTPWLAGQRGSAHVVSVDVFSPEALAQQLATLHGRHEAVPVLDRLQVPVAAHPRLRVQPRLDGHDDSAQTERLVTRLLRREPDLAALNSIGAGNRGIRAALESSGRAGSTVWICHELTPHAWRALLDGVADAVINQDAGHEVRSAVRVALARLSGECAMPDQDRIRIDIFLKENLP